MTGRAQGNWLTKNIIRSDQLRFILILILIMILILLLILNNNNAEFVVGWVGWVVVYRHQLP